MDLWAPRVVVMVDWSASSTRGPLRPAPDRCWLASGAVDAADRPAPRYFRTREECLDGIEGLIDSQPVPTLVGLDFPIGYARDEHGRPVLPEGRALVAHVAPRIEDRAGTNNRFEVARALNLEIAARTGRAEGPFWGCPPARVLPGLTPTKTRDAGVAEYRPCELRLRAARRNIQSAWKLLGIGSVGSQALLGLAAVARLLARAGERGRLWPFEPLDRPDAVVVAEIWPTLGDFTATRYAVHPIKDARQVAAMRDWALDDAAALHAALHHVPAEAAGVGWILGAP